MANIFDFGFKEYKIKMDGSNFMGGYFAVMGDTARRVEVQLLGTDNTVRDASGLRLQLWADAGGKVSYVEGEAVEPEEGRYRFDLINGLLLSPGVQKFQWRIIDSDGRKINSVQFKGGVGNDLEGDAWEDVHQLYLNTGQLKKEVDEVTNLQKDLIDGAVDSAAIQQHVEERYSDLEAEYAEDLSTLKRSDENLTAQLAQTERELILKPDRTETGWATLNILTEEERAKLLGLEPGEINGVLGGHNVKDGNVAPREISMERLSFIQKSTNLYNKNTAKRWKTINLDNGEEEDHPDAGISDYIPISPNTPYSVVLAYTSAFYDVDKKYISRPAIQNGKFISHEDAYYVRLIFPTGGWENVQMNTGNALLPFEDFYEYIPETKIEGLSEYNSRIKETEKKIKETEKKLSDVVTGRGRKNKIVNMPRGWYNPSVQNEHRILDLMLEDIYGTYDEMTEKNPGYVTRHFFGNDESNNYPIFYYHFKPEEVEAELSESKIPKYIIITNLHGDEKASTLSLMNFMNDVCDNWVTNDFLEFVRHNIELIIVPIANPYGFTEHIRHNVNGVDLNRNFDDGSWEDYSYNSGEGEFTYKGSSAFSEAETQYIRDLILSNLDAEALFDYHTNGTSGGVYETMFWHYLMNDTNHADFEKINTLSKYNIKKMTIEAQKEFPELFPSNSGFIGYISYTKNHPTLANYALSQGVTGNTIECTRRTLNGSTGRYTAETNQLNMSFIGNTILNTVRVFNEQINVGLMQTTR